MRRGAREHCTREAEFRAVGDVKSGGKALHAVYRQHRTKELLLHQGVLRVFDGEQGSGNEGAASNAGSDVQFFSTRPWVFNDCHQACSGLFVNDGR